MDQVVQDYKAKSDRVQNNIWNFWVTLYSKLCNFFAIDKIWYTCKNDYCPPMILNPLNPKIIIQTLQTGFHTFLEKLLERIFKKSKHISYSLNFINSHNVST